MNGSNNAKLLSFSLLFVVITSSCTRSENARPSLQTNSSAAAKTATESGKPTEDSEGIPGYLVDPSMVKVAATEPPETPDPTKKRYPISAPPGTIVSSNGSPEKITLAFWGSWTWDIVSTTTQILMAAPNPTLRASFKKAIHPNADGSFSTFLEVEDNMYLIITTDIETTDANRYFQLPDNMTFFSRVFAKLVTEKPMTSLISENVKAAGIDAGAAIP